MDAESADVMVLGAVRQGKKKFDSIRKATNLNPDDLERALADLERNGFIMVRMKKGWLGTKIEILITDKGSNELDNRLYAAREQWGQMQQMYQRKDKKGLQGMMDSNRSILPMMLFFGIIDIMMFSMMFSMMGMMMSSYVPAESMPPGAEDAGAGADGDSGGDYGGDAGDVGVDHGFGDAGGFDMGF